MISVQSQSEPIGGQHSRERFSTPAIALGLLSIACGGMMCVAPRRSAALLALPRSKELTRLIGVRDVCIGTTLLIHRSRRLGFALRSLADVADGALIAAQAVRGKTHRLHGSINTLVAAASAAYASHLYRLARPS